VGRTGPASAAEPFELPEEPLLEPPLLDEEPPLELEFWTAPLLPPLLPPLLLDPPLLEVPFPLLEPPPLLLPVWSEYNGDEGCALQPVMQAAARTLPSPIERWIFIVLSA
jgi:hypothetical protein